MSDGDTERTRVEEPRDANDAKTNSNDEKRQVSPARKRISERVIRHGPYDKLQG
jgi:hypothetical protein